MLCGGVDSNVGLTARVAIGTGVRAGIVILVDVEQIDGLIVDVASASTGRLVVRTLQEDVIDIVPRVVAFGRLADALAKHAKGETLSASGRFELSRWTDAEGNERESWQLIADGLVSARTVRPGGKRGARGNGNASTGPANASEAAPFNDELPPF